MHYMRVLNNMLYEDENFIEGVNLQIDDATYATLDFDKKYVVINSSLQEYIPVVSLAEAKNIKIAQLNTNFTNKLKNGYTFSTLNLKFNAQLSDMDMYDRAYRLMEMVQASDSDTTTILMFGNASAINITKSDLKSLIIELAANYRNFYDLRYLKQVEITSCTTVTDVDNVNISLN